MAKRTATSSWVKVFNRNLAALTRSTRRVQVRAVKRASTPMQPPATPGDWLGGMALGPGGARRYHLYRPPDLQSGERLPLLVMLHGCGQDAAGFAQSTRMNALARRERFMVLYPEQDRLASAQRCWNWYEIRNGRAHTEVALILAAIDQVCLLQPVDRTRVALAGLSAGASMAALVASRHPARFKAVVMHSGMAPGAADSTATALAAMRVTDFKHRGRTAVTLIDVDRLGHAWSSGAPNQPYSDAQGPDASRMVWAFVSKQFPSARVPAVPKATRAVPRPDPPSPFNIPSFFNPFALLAFKGATLKP
jgi:poly(hydroxyalkanoate) depolymerase family esterase